VTVTEAIGLYFRYFSISIRGQMQYRASFLMMTAGLFLVTGVEFMGIVALFARFKVLATWRLEEVALFYGLISIGFALAEAAARGFDKFDLMVKTGGFDRILLRPRSSVLQVAAQELQLMRVGRLVQGMAVLLWASSRLDIDWTIAKEFLVLFTIFGGACLFYGLFVLQATLCFWSTETLEIVNVTTYGGVEAAQFPISIYRPSFRKFFTFVVPLACVTYFPALAILGRDDPVMGSPVWFRWSAPLIGILFLFICLQVWKIGVRHYRSTGS
jgi:ABC-2 type transport system permease protein